MRTGKKDWKAPARLATKHPFTFTSWELGTHQAPITEVVPDLNIQTYHLPDKILKEAKGTNRTCGVWGDKQTTDIV